ncbi:hypothetical protein [Nakamurella panacisegetis]|nr:hypothetical protein [Nakamurella panacisegetis]
MVNEISNIQALDGQTYLASVTDEEATVDIRISVSAAGLERIGMAAGDEPRIVRETLAYLLDRQRADELPDTLDLEDVIAAYDDYTDDIHRRVARSAQR